MSSILIKLKYSTLAFIIALIPYGLLISIMRTFKGFTPLHLNTILILGISTAIINAIYIYITITKKIKPTI